MDDNAAFTGFIDWLEARHASIMAEERQALALLAAGDKPGYAAKMRAKAESLASLAKDAAPKLAGLPEAQREQILNGLMRFSQSAANGLNIGSLFYMSALLYPDEHKPGEPDNLALFIKRLKVESPV